MMRERVMRVLDPDLRIRATGQFTPHHERHHASEVALIGENLQIEHQLHVLFERRWNTSRRLDVGQHRRRALSFGGLYPAFDVTNALEVLLDLEPVAAANPMLERGDLVC